MRSGDAPAADAEFTPAEFTPEAVAARSPPEERLFGEFHASGAEPAASLARLGLTFNKDPNSPTHLNTDDEQYYNTAGSATAHWAGKGLPAPTKDIRAMRDDLRRWGYCLIAEAQSAGQLAAMRARVVEQAAGERAAGVGLWLNASATGSNTQFGQTSGCRHLRRLLLLLLLLLLFLLLLPLCPNRSVCVPGRLAVTTLLNKGVAFEGALNFDPHHVQVRPSAALLVAALCLLHHGSAGAGAAGDAAARWRCCR